MLREKLTGIEARYQELNALMGDPEIAMDYERVAELAQEKSNLEEIVAAAREYIRVLDELEGAREMAQAEDDPDMAAMAQAEVSELEAQQNQLEAQIQHMLLPKDPRDDKNVIVEIRAGTGGDEAALFAADLARMYMRYAEERRWKTEIISANETGQGGYKEVIFEVKGHGAFSRLKYESGVHRVQRVPMTESQGRIHTSTATVAVLAQVEDIEIEINSNDLMIDTYRSAGAGGQNVQKNETAIRITHVPSGLVVACQDERSQLQNRMRAMAILRARLYDAEQRRQQEERASERRSQVGTGERSEKIRTYNYPQSRVTDHRINISSYNLAGVMEGDLDQFVDELAMREQAERLAEA
ncbi:MAG: peptide chain release factor 1 [Anaerolineae bacterium]|nr:peptide chain release factor 1 [Anaerolineae bacterium]